MRAMNSLGFDDLQLFARLAALGSLSAVARERGVPVSQVSRRLRQIEAACGARLVHRNTHGLQLSAEGHTLLGYCQRLAGTLDELAAEFAGHSGQPRGLVRVAASSAIAQTQLLPSLPSLHQAHPLLQVDLVVGDALADLAREGIDIAIRTAQTLPDTLVARPLGLLGRALYAAPAYLAQAGMPHSPDALQQHRLITNSAVPALNHWPFTVDGQPVQRLAEGFWRANDTGGVLAMAVQGLGIARLATLAAQPLVQQGRLVPVLAELVDLQPVPIVAITASSRQRLPKIRACLDHWAQWFQQAATPPGPPAPVGGG